MKKLNK